VTSQGADRAAMYSTFCGVSLDPPMPLNMELSKGSKF
jgi:flavin reductase (DIM6/NTAB) family NADH-FMN oxidoreductase RutF